MNFSEKDFTDFSNLIEEVKKIDREEAETIAYSLQHIQNSIHKIYNDLLQSAFSREHLDEDQALDLYIEIQEELRHIDYHIHDAKLLDEVL